jgi:hypothetical protein
MPLDDLAGCHRHDNSISRKRAEKKKRSLAAKRRKKRKRIVEKHLLSVPLAPLCG